MLFEKSIRKKRIPVFYLESLAYLISVRVICILTSITIWIAASLIVGLWFQGIYIKLYLGWLIMTVVIFLLSANSTSTRLHNFVLPFRLFRDTKNKRVSVLDEVIVDYYLSFAEEYRTGDGYTYSYSYMFFAEPFLFVAEFATLPFGTNVPCKKPLYIFLINLHWTYRLHKGYKKIKEDFEKDLEQDILVYEKGEAVRIYDKKKAGLFYMYITSEKRKVLNRLFELVNPPEFRITTYEKSKVFISIEPIPGKEYPPEALECMEKINAMYP